MEKVLITGISGGQGRLLARRLRENYEVCGVDRVGWDGAPRGVSVHTVDVRKKKFEDVIRTEMPTAIVHMGFIRHFRASEQERYDVNVRGTKQLLDHCVNHGVQSLVVLSSSYVYGAAPENPYYMDEDAPLAASRSYPEIRDLVEVDTLASELVQQSPRAGIERAVALREGGVLKLLRLCFDLVDEAVQVRGQDGFPERGQWQADGVEEAARTRRLAIDPAPGINRRDRAASDLEPEGVRCEQRAVDVEDHEFGRSTLRPHAARLLSRLKGAGSLQATRAPAGASTTGRRAHSETDAVCVPSGLR